MNNNNEIAIKDLMQGMWQQKWILIAFIFVFAVGSVAFAITRPNIFKAEVILAPSTNDSQAQGMGSQLGGLAALAGVNLGGDTSKVNLALETLQSRQFVSKFIHDNNAMIPLIALEKWDPTAQKEIINNTIYDEASKKWVREVPEGRSVIPTDWEAYKLFQEIVSSETTPKGFIKLSVESQSPRLAQIWANNLVTELNNWIKVRDVEETTRNIQYLKDQLSTTSIAEMQKVFYQLIEEQTKKLMLAEAQQEYVFKVVDPAVFPEEKDSPRRALICIVGTFLGGVFGLFVTLGVVIYRAGREKPNA